MKKVVLTIMGGITLLAVGGFAVYWFVIRDDPAPPARIKQTKVAEDPRGESALDGTIAGATVDEVTITANLQALVSDETRRDNRLRTSGLETDTFPTAEFVLDEPIDLGTVPAAGETVDVTATGSLTLHGVTRAVEVPLEARWDGSRVQVVGRLPIVFSDYDIEAPSIAGFVSVEDRGEMELQLFFEPS